MIAVAIADRICAGVNHTNSEKNSKCVSIDAFSN